VLAAAGLTILLWALIPVTTRIATRQIDGMSVGVFRTVGAGIVSFPILLAFRLRPPPRDRLHCGALAISALGGFVAFPVLFSLGTQLTSASHAGLVLATIPLFTGIVGTSVDRRLPRGLWIIGAMVALLGEAVMVLNAAGPGEPGATGSVIGDALVLAACIAVSAGVVAGARLGEKVGAWTATFWSIVLGATALAPWAVVEGKRLAWTLLTMSSWLALVHLALGAGVVAWASWFWAMARGGVARVAVLQFCQPLVTLVIASWLLSEPLTVPLLLSTAVILAGVVIARRGESTADTAPPSRHHRRAGPYEGG
jgi:drug/metabolite transporter (DMT)-like permease